MNLTIFLIVIINIIFKIIIYDVHGEILWGDWLHIIITIINATIVAIPTK